MFGSMCSTARKNWSCRVSLAAARLIGLLLALSLVFPAALPARAQVATPVLVSPADNTISTVENYPPLGIPSFSWEPVPEATKYRIQLSYNDPGFASSNIKLDKTTVSTEYTPLDASAFADGDWYWRVKVETPAGGGYSDPFMFVKSWASEANRPVLTAPADGAVLDFYDSPIFSWQPVTGAATYDFEVALSPDGFGTPQ